ncbi:hypothetical protein ACSQ67_018407 [Phaseolus vulgaris]
MLPITLLAKPFRSLTMFLLVVPKFVVAHHPAIWDVCLEGLWSEGGVGAGNRISWLSELLQQCSVGQAEAEEAQMFIYHMLDKGVEPDVTSYTFLLEGLCQEDKIEAPFELYYNLSDAQEIPIVIEHLKWVREKSPLILCTGLLDSISSSATCPETDNVIVSSKDTKCV